MKNFIKKMLLSLMIVISLTNLITPNYSQAFSGGDLAKPIFEFIAWLGDCVIEFLQKTIGNGGEIQDPITGEYTIGYTIGNIFANNVALLDVNFINPGTNFTKIGNKKLLLEEKNIGKSPVADINKLYEYEEQNLASYGFDRKTIIGEGDIYYTQDQEYQYTWTYNNNKYYYVIKKGNYTSNYSGNSWYDIKLYEEGVEYKTSIASDLQSTISKWYKGIRRLSLVGLLSVLVYIGIRIIISSSSEDKAKYKKMLSSWVAAVCIVFVLHYIMVFIMSLSESLTNMLKSNVTGNLGEDVAVNYIRTQIGNDVDDLLTVIGETVCYVALIILTVIFTIQYLKRVVYMAFLTMIAPLIALTYPIDKIKDGKAQAFSMWLREYIFNALLQPVHLLLYIIFVVSIGVDFIQKNMLYSIVAIAFLVPAEKFFKKMFGMDSQTSVGTLGAAAGGAMVMNMLNKMKGAPPKQGGEKPTNIRTNDQNGGIQQQLPPTIGGNGGGRTPIPTTGGILGARQNPSPTPSTLGGNTGASQNPSTLGGNLSAAPEVARFEEATGMQARDVVAPLAGAGLGLAGAMLTSDPSGSRPNSSEGGTAGTTARNTSTNGGATNTESNTSGSSSGGNTVIVPVSGQRFTRTPVKPSVWRGINALGSKYVYGKEGRARTRKAILGAAGGIMGATIGVAAGVATGDLGNAFSYGIAGGAAGAIGAQNLGENVVSGAETLKNAETFKKGYMGAEAYNNAQFDKQFFKSEEYKMLEAEYGKGIKGEVQGFLSQGFTDTEQIRKMLDKGVSAETYGAYAGAGIKDAEVIRKLQTAGANNTPITAETYGAYAEAGLRDVDKISDLAKAGVDATKYAELASAGITNINTIKKHKGKTAAQLRNMKRIATHSKKAMENVNVNDVDAATGVPRAFTDYARGFGASDEMIKELWKNLEDFM